MHNLEGVGKNLQDHLETYIQQECKTPDTLYSFTKLFNKIRIGIEWFLFKKGPCSYSFLEAGGFAKSSERTKDFKHTISFFSLFCNRSWFDSTKFSWISTTR